MKDDDYLYIQLTARQDDAYVQFQVQGIIDKYIPPTTPPPIIGVTPGTPGAPPPIVPGVTPGTPGAPPVGASTVKTSSTSSINLPLIIGAACGGLGFLALVGFLIFYVSR